MSNTIVIGTDDNRGSRIGTMESETWGQKRGRRIREAREAKDWSQGDLAEKTGVSQPAIKKIEDGGGSSYMARVFLALGLNPAEIEPPHNTPESQLEALQFGAVEERLLPSPRLDFPIYAAAEGGPGEIIRSSDPVDYVGRPAPLAKVEKAYGLYVIGESMVPEYRPGDIALINPRLPVIGGEVYVFYAELDGEARATIKHLRRQTADKWLVSQHNKPKDFELRRGEWQWAHRAIGKYSRQ